MTLSGKTIAIPLNFGRLLAEFTEEFMMRKTAAWPTIAQANKLIRIIWHVLIDPFDFNVSKAFAMN